MSLEQTESHLRLFCRSEGVRHLLLYPDYRFRRVWDITPQWLAGKGIDALLLDVDNTLTTHDSPGVDPRVLEWLAVLGEHGVKLAILSNNSRERVEPFAKKLGLRFFARAKKPLGGGARRAMELLGAGKTAVVGDQIFTDILCARLAGLVPVMVELMEPEPFLFFKIKRALEHMVLRGCKIPLETGEREESV